MHLAVILRITGILLTVFSLTMLTPVPVALWYGETGASAFVLAFAITFAVGVLFWLAARDRRELRSSDGFMITALFYAGLGTFGALPFWMIDALQLGFTDAVFESLSGLTTTGATVLTGLDDAPRSILFWRQQLQWLGGMGIVVLAVAVLPMLGVGGMQLYRAESPGPVKDAKLTPRITETAKALWYIYLSLTITCALAYLAAGMTPFDAVTHAFSTVAIGGFSTHDASLGYFDSVAIDSVAMVFMVLSGVNFGLHFIAWRRRTPLYYLRDPELRGYLGSLIAVSALVVVVLAYQTSYSFGESLHHGLFQTISIATTTGFVTTDFSAWPLPLPFLLLFTSFVGGCAGSTAGGLKVVRAQLIYLQGLRELRRLVHPQAVIPLKLGRNPVPDRVLEAMWGFISAYGLLFVLMVMILLATGLDFVTAFSAVTACLNNLGPGLGEAALHYATLPDAAKWVLIFAMMLGRLEVFTLLVLLTPTFWRR